MQRRIDGSVAAVYSAAMEGPPVRYRVLIVDDAPEVREALRYALEDEVDLVVVGGAGAGDEALDRVTELAPDVVLLDIELPGLDGYAVARSLKASIPPPVVVFLTVHSDAVSRRRAAEAGGDGFVDKASGWSTLMAEVRRTLASRPPGGGAPTQGKTPAP
jgi:DNA-binding NarL/FixJ family response regulator